MPLQFLQSGTVGSRLHCSGRTHILWTSFYLRSLCDSTKAQASLYSTQLACHLGKIIIIQGTWKSSCNKIRVRYLQLNQIPTAVGGSAKEPSAGSPCAISLWCQCTRTFLHECPGQHALTVFHSLGISKALPRLKLVLTSRNTQRQQEVSRLR